MNLFTRIFFIVLLIGMMATALLLPKFVKSPNPVEPPKVEYLRPSKTLEMLPEYVATKKQKEFQRVVESPLDTGAPVPPNYNEVLMPFLELLNSGDLVEASDYLRDVDPTIPPAIKSSLKLSLISAEDFKRSFALAKTETVNAESAKQKLQMMARDKERWELALAEATAIRDQSDENLADIIAKTNELEHQQISITEKFGTLQETHFETLQKSIKDLAEVTKSVNTATRIARQSAKEAARFQTDIRTRLSAAVTGDDIDTENIPLVLPEPSLIRFNSNSSILPSEAAKPIERIAIFLNHDSRLGIQLHAHGDPSQVADFNQVITNARSQQILAELINKGVDRRQVDIINTDVNGSPDDSNRLKMIFTQR